jgi:AcrR family transcriptional regulator
MVNKATRKRMDIELRREELLALGLKLFARYTYDELSIASIAEKAGISKGLLYHYFPAKRDFYVETVRAAAGQLVGLITGDPRETPLVRLRQGLGAYLNFVEENSAAYLSLVNGGIGIDPEVSRIVESARGRVVKLIVDALGLRDPAPLHLMALHGWVHFAEGASQAWLRDKSVARDELQRLIARQLIFVVSTQAAFAGLRRALLVKITSMLEVPA